MVTYKIGTGLVVARRDDGSWSPPSAISSFGLGWGAQVTQLFWCFLDFETVVVYLLINHLQAGGEFIDFIIVLRTREAIRTFGSNTHLVVGAGLSAAVGVTGRAVEADLRAGSGGYAACYTYSCSKGNTPDSCISSHNSFQLVNFCLMFLALFPSMFTTSFHGPLYICNHSNIPIKNRF